MPFETDERWIELSYGIYEGVPHADVPSEAWVHWRQPVLGPRGRRVAGRARPAVRRRARARRAGRRPDGRGRQPRVADQGRRGVGARLRRRDLVAIAPVARLGVPHRHARTGPVALRSTRTDVTVGAEIQNGERAMRLRTDTISPTWLTRWPIASHWTNQLAGRPLPSCRAGDLALVDAGAGQSDGGLWGGLELGRFQVVEPRGRGVHGGVGDEVLEIKRRRELGRFGLSEADVRVRPPRPRLSRCECSNGSPRSTALTARSS